MSNQEIEAFLEQEEAITVGTPVINGEITVGEIIFRLQSLTAIAEDCRQNYEELPSDENRLQLDTAHANLIGYVTRKYVLA